MKRTKKILIVEDEKVIQALCRRLLAKMGYEPFFAGGVREAVEKFRSARHLDLLITDMRLPDGDGVEVIGRFRQKYPSTKVLIVTGSPVADPGMEQLEEMGFTEKDVLFKPFTMREFESMIRQCLGDA